jgi:hypothetical protein
MEISDIQLEGYEQTGNVVITFCSTDNFEDIMTLKLKVSDAWKIHKFCQRHLSYAAQQKKVNKTKKYEQEIQFR